MAYIVYPHRAEARVRAELQRKFEADAAAATLAKERDWLCTRCGSRLIDAVNMPCKHALLCGECTENNRTANGDTCPVCKETSETLSHKIDGVEAETTQLECCVCLDDVDQRDIVTLASCGHFCCVTCFATHITTLLGDASDKFPVDCFADPQCGPSTTNYKSKWRTIWIRDAFCYRIPAPWVLGVPTKTRLKSSIPVKKFKSHLM